MARIQRTNGKICRRNGKLEPCGGCGCFCTTQLKLTFADVVSHPDECVPFQETIYFVKLLGEFLNGDYPVPFYAGCQGFYYTGSDENPDLTSAIVVSSDSECGGGECFRNYRIHVYVLNNRVYVEVDLFLYSSGSLIGNVSVFGGAADVVDGPIVITNGVYPPGDTNPHVVPSPLFTGGTCTIACNTDTITPPTGDPVPCGDPICRTQFTYQWNCETNEVVQDVTLVGTTCESYPGSDWEVTDISWPITTLRKYVVTGPCTTGGDCYDADYPEAPDVISLGGCGTCPPNAPIIEAGLSEEGNLIGFLDAGDYIAEYIDGAWLPGPEGVYSYSTEVAVANSDANVVYDHIGEPYYTGPGILDYEAAESLAAGKRYKFTVYADANYFLRCRDDPGFYGDDTAGDPYNARYRICPMNPLP